MVLDNDDDLGSTVSLATLKLSLLDAVLTVVEEIGLADTKAMHNARRQTKSVDLEANIMDLLSGKKIEDTQLLARQTAFYIFLSTRRWLKVNAGRQ